MAVNQVSLFFYPPRWTQRLVAKPSGPGQEGKPRQVVYLVDAVFAKNTERAPVSAERLKGWLTEHGFAPEEWGQGSTYVRGQIVSIFGLEKEIEVSVGEQGGEATEVYCRFTLPRHQVPPLAEWAGFVASLCRAFELRLETEASGPCSETGFVEAVRGSQNYQEFAMSLGWEATGR